MNRIVISGYLEENPEFLYELKGEKFYKVNLVSERLSGLQDVLPCIVPDIFARLLSKNDYVRFAGDIRTRNVMTEGKRKLEIYVFVNEVYEYEAGESDENCVEIDGFICKDAIYRKTPLGREITDLLVASNRRYGKSDYIPCIAWGRNAKKTANLEVSEQVRIIGRFQSREYLKTLESGETVSHTAYEVSISKVEIGGQSE